MTFPAARRREQTDPLEDALALTPVDGVLEASIDGDFSNGPISAPPEAGFPFGGLLAALAARAMRQGLGLSAPLRSLSVQYLAAARFGAPLRFAPRLLRGGRSVAFAAVDAGQAGRATHHATATYGADMESVTLDPPTTQAWTTDRLAGLPGIDGPMSPRFSQAVDYAFDGGPHILGGNIGRPAVERVWMRIKGGGSLDEAGLCYLLDALYPPSWTAFRSPPMMTTVDLRYDILADPTPETAPDGWALFEFRVFDLGLGWTVDEATAWGADGRPLALSRQRRKLLGLRPAPDPASREPS